ncbi:MAG: 16S rRNA (guanine(966)-N(2))-methyltransferase RsmD [Alphaproteobacteria bacterium]
MRIVAGKYGSRILKTPEDNSIRPTSDKIRGAIFNMLRSRGAVDGAHVLDVFCGTGALGLEALSQGAAFCTFIDNDKIALDLTRQNVGTLGAGNDSDFILRDARNLGPRPEFISRAELVFLDPPYNKNLAGPSLINLAEQGWLAPGCICVLETEKNHAHALMANFEMLDERTYGDTKVTLSAFSQTG